MTHEAPPKPDMARAIKLLDANNSGDPVGWRGINEDPRLHEPCTDGCLAPGSSPHTHVVRKGFILIGTRGYVEVDLNMIPQVVGTIRPFEEAQSETHT